MGLLGDVYSYGDTLKRKVGGLLNDPRGTLEQFVGQLGDDMNTNISNMKTGYGFGGNKSVLSDPAQVQAAQRALADYGAQSGMASATVWHGSPHKFDKFDSSKIGTGEGAQAYGHGLYFAEAPSVAKEYATKLSSAGLARNTLAQSGGDIDGAIAAASRSVDNYRALLANGGGGDPQRAKSMLNLAEKKLGDLHAMKGGTLDEAGSLYKVDLPDEHIAKMLDWDKPLSQQHPSVQEIFGKSDKMTGAQALKAIEANPEQYLSQVLQGRELTGAMIRPERGSSEFLKRKGIPGIRYLDGGSRGTGAGTSNYVVFPGNEGMLQILERNNKALDIFKDTTWEPPLFPDTTR